VGTLDLHANVSPRLAEAADVWIAYRTNPHLDQLERGLEAARLLARTLRGEIRPTSAAAFPPFLVNIASQLTSEAPCKPLYDFAEEIRHRPGVLAVSLLLAFPYADVPQLGSSVLITTDNDPALARKYADEIARYWWERREQFLGDRIAPFAAVAEAGVRTGPVCLLDMGDNVGGGSPGDGTILLHELSRQAVGPAFVCLADAESVLQARTAGAGALVCLHVGGKTDNRHGPPFEAEFQVVSLHDGHFQETQTRHGGFTTFDQGPTAIVRHARITIMLTTRRMAPFSLAQLTTFGIEPAEFQVLVAKGVHAPVAAYAPVCRSLIRVDTPGITRADVTQLPFQQRRRPMYPFEPDTIWP
jgi:microcystin degradation protein MlrC